MTGICQGSTALAAPKLFQAMAEAIDKLIEWQNKQGAYVVDTELTALTQQINVELVVQMGAFSRFTDGFLIVSGNHAVRRMGCMIRPTSASLRRCSARRAPSAG